MFSQSITPCGPVGPASARPVAFAALALACLIPGCYNIKPHIPASEGHITKEQVKGEPAKAIPPPARVSEFLPPPKPAVKPQTYSVVVNEVPVKDLIRELLEFVDDVVDELDSRKEIEHINTILDRGTSADEHHRLAVDPHSCQLNASRPPLPILP